MVALAKAVCDFKCRWKEKLFPLYPTCAECSRVGASDKTMKPHSAVWFSILNVAAGDTVTHPLWLDFVLCGNLHWVHSTPPIHHYLLAILLISPPPLPPPPPPPSLKPPAALLPPFSTICYLFKTSHPALASHHPPPPNPSPTTPPPNTF